MKFLYPLLTIFSLSPITLTQPLKCVIIVYRHGDRSPESKCPVLTTTWKEGYGSLLDSGKRKAYKLGEYFREKYGGILSPHYDESEIYVKSSDFSRTIMTAEYVMAGLYKSQDKFQQSSDTCQLLPVHSIPRKYDDLIYYYDFAGVACPEYFQHLYERTSDFKKQIDGYVGTLKEMSKISPDIQLPPDPLGALRVGEQLRDCFFIEETHGGKLPKWVRNYYPQPLTDTTKLFFTIFDSDVTLKRLHCGLLLKDIIRIFEKIIKGEKGFESMKMYQYSGHDTTIVGLLQCLNLYDGELVPYLSTVMLELYEGKSINNHQIVIKYRKENEYGYCVERALVVPGCNPKSDYCDFETFKNSVKNNLPDNWEEECTL